MNKREWIVFPGGTVVPRIAGAADDDEGGASGEGDTEDASQPPASGGDWREQISEDIRAQLPEDVDSLDKMAKEFVNARHLVGMDRVPVPSKGLDEDPAAWGEVFERLGRPREPKGYELSDVAKDGKVQPKEEFVDGYRQKAHELGLSNTQAARLYDWFWETTAKEMDQITGSLKERRENADAELDKLYGNAKDEKVAAAKEAINQFAPEGFHDFLRETGLGNDPRMVQFAVKVADAMKEDTLGPATRRSSASTMTPDVAQARISEIMRDEAWSVQGARKDPHRHRELVEEVNRLTPMAYPEDAQVVVFDERGQFRGRHG